MTLAEWESKGWLQKGAICKDEIFTLLIDAENDLMDARRDLPPEWSFRLSCTAAMSLCTLLLYSVGYRAEKELHLKAVKALPVILGNERTQDSEYLEACLNLRNAKDSAANYIITSSQALRLLQFAEDF